MDKTGEYSSDLKIVQPISFPVISAVYELMQKNRRRKNTVNLV